MTQEEIKKLTPVLTESVLEEIHSLRSQKKAIEERLDWVLEHLRMSLEGKEKPYSNQVGEYNLILREVLTAKIEWEKFVGDKLGSEVVEALKEAAKCVKQGTHESGYVKIVESTRVEVTKLN